jgi:hypothetical protein
MWATGPVANWSSKKLLETVTDPEFHRLVRVEDIGLKELRLDLRAAPPALRGVAGRLGLERLNALSAKVSLCRRGREGIGVSVDFSADLVQFCVISLESVPSVVTETFVVICGVETDELDDRDVVIDPMVDDPPEPIVDGLIDVGELIVQHLSLAMEPYPRAPGVAPLEEQDASENKAAGADDEGIVSESPFSVLKGLRVVKDPGN